MKLVLPGGGGAGGIITRSGGSGMMQIFFLEFDTFYFLTYMILRISKLSPKLSTYGWDTLYIWIKIVSELAVWPWACLKYFHSGAPDEDIYIGKLQKITATFSNYSTTKTWLR